MRDLRKNLRQYIELRQALGYISRRPAAFHDRRILKYCLILPVEVAIVARTEMHFPRRFESDCSVSVEL